MKYIFYTWNTRHDIRGGVRGLHIDGFFGGRMGVAGVGGEGPYVCIQEGGERAQAPQNAPYKLVSGVGVGAFNEQCTNYVLFPNAQPVAAPAIIAAEDGRAVIGGGVAGRTPAALSLRGNGGLLVVSWHSLAGPDNADTNILISAIQTGGRAGDDVIHNTFDKVVIGGDFNSEPDRVEEILGQYNANGSYRFFKFGTDRDPTYHPDGGGAKVFDFFVILSKAAIDNPAIEHGNQFGSDHDYMKMSVEL